MEGGRGEVGRGGRAGRGGRGRAAVGGLLRREVREGARRVAAPTWHGGGRRGGELVHLDPPRPQHAIHGSVERGALHAVVGRAHLAAHNLA